MTIPEFKATALAAIKANPGLTRMEWFNACHPIDDTRDALWHTFKFQISMVLILGGHVKHVGDLFFHKSHITQ